MNTTVPKASLLHNQESKAGQTKVNKEARVVPSMYSKPIKLEDLEDYVKRSIENAELEKQHEVISFMNSALRIFTIILPYLIAAFSPG